MGEDEADVELEPELIRAYGALFTKLGNKQFSDSSEVFRLATCFKKASRNMNATKTQQSLLDFFFAKCQVDDKADVAAITTEVSQFGGVAVSGDVRVHCKRVFKTMLINKKGIQDLDRDTVDLDKAIESIRTFAHDKNISLVDGNWELVKGHKNLMHLVDDITLKSEEEEAMAADTSFTLVADKLQRCLASLRVNLNKSAGPTHAEYVEQVRKHVDEGATLQAKIGNQISTGLREALTQESTAIKTGTNDSGVGNELAACTRGNVSWTMFAQRCQPVVSSIAEKAMEDRIETIKRQFDKCMDVRCKLSMPEDSGFEETRTSTIGSVRYVLVMRMLIAKLTQESKDPVKLMMDMKKRFKTSYACTKPNPM